MDFFKGVFKSISDTADKLIRDKDVQKWLDELGDAQKREKDWRTEGKRVIDLYEQQSSADDAGSKANFNILYANTETLAPAIYNNVPRPVVKRKVNKEDPTAIAAAHVLKATLTYLTDTGNRDETSFDDLQKTAVLEALVPGRGLARFAYEADVDEEAMVTRSECVYGDSVPWNRVVFGYAKVAAKIPWMSFEHFMTRDECIKNFGEEKGKAIKLTHAPSDDKDAADGKDNGPADAEGVKFAHIWEVWDKRDKKVKFLSEGLPTFIDVREDPAKLDGFFPCPKPIQLINRVSSLVPQTLYLLYENQAKELEDVTRRIGSLTRAMKIRGLYDGTIEGLDDLLSSPENTILPARNVAALQQGQTLEKSIWLMPLEKLILVLQQLYANRQQIISVIHQITGIADIMRGASQASETLGAQKMKEAWGTMRLKRMQKEVQRFTRDCYRIQAELAAKHFSIETFKKMTGVQLPMAAEKAKAQQAMHGLIAQADDLKAQAQSGQANMQELQGQMQQLGQQAQQYQPILSVPTWEDVCEFMKSDSIRNYVIDIETNSTIDIEATEDKAELAEMMNSMSQLMNGVFPMVKEGVLPFPAAKALMLAVIGKFRMGDEVEETFRAMQEPKPQADPAADKVKAEMQRDQQKFTLEQQGLQAEMAAAKQTNDMALQTQQADLNFKREELALQAEELRLKGEFMREKHRVDMEMLALKLTQAKEPASASV